MKTTIETRTVIIADLPDFAVWQAQRDQCEWCRSMRRVGPTSLHCVHPSVRAIIGKRRGLRAVACIEARDPGKPCGPDGALWEAL